MSEMGSPHTSYATGATRGRDRGLRRAIAIGAVAATLLVLLPSTTPAQAAPVILQPGEERSDVTLGHRIVNEHGSSKAGDFAVGDVAENPGRNRVRLLTHAAFCEVPEHLAGRCDEPGNQSAFARGELFYEFCVPVEGSSTCGTGTAPPEDVTATMSFDYAFLGRLETTLATAANAAATFRVHDVTRAETLVFDTLLEVGAEDGRIIKLKGAPIPLPDSEEVAGAHQVNFQVTVPRGHRIRFSVFFAGRAETRSLGGGAVAGAIFTSRNALDGQFAVSDLDIHIGAGGPGPGEIPEEVRRAFERLSLELAELAERLDELDLDVDERFGLLDELLNARFRELLTAVEQLGDRTDVLETEVADLTTTVEEQDSRIADLEALVATQGQQVAELMDLLREHQHGYDAPRGRGNNRVPETTGAAEFPSDAGG